MKKKNLYINRQKGILIAFEGVSGCGKSAGVESLYRYLLSQGYKTKVIEWNSNKAIRGIVDKIHSMKLLTSSLYSLFQWISFLLDYYLRITPLLRKNYILIADRYIYTGYTRDIANEAGQMLVKKLHRVIRKPDLIFFYDIDLQVCYQRIEKRGKALFYPNKRLDKNEVLKDKNLGYLVSLQQEYIRLFQDPTLAKKTNIIHLGPRSDLAEIKIRVHVEEYIRLKSENACFSDKILE